MADTIDDWLFGLIAAPADLGGVPLIVAVVLARWAILLGPAALVALWFTGRGEDRRAAVAAALAALLGLSIAAVLSAAYFEPRPFMEGAARNVFDHAPDSGYPSDHATLLFAIAFGLRLRRPPSRPRLWIPAAALALAVGWARVFLGVHYPVDIAAAAFVGVLAAATLVTSPGLAATERLTLLGDAASSRVLAAVGWRAPP